MLAEEAELVEAYDTLPQFMYMRNSWRYFVDRAQLGAIPILLALAGLVWSVSRASRSDEGRRDLAGCLTLSLGLFFYAFASLRYFAHVPLFLQYFWCALFGGALFLDRLRLPFRVVIALLLTPGIFYVAKNVYWTPRDAQVEGYRTPSGDVLYLHAGEVRRVEAIRKAVHRYLPGLVDAKRIETWRGLRPCTPDGLPIISRSDSVRNLVIAAGHAMLGMSLGPVTGKLVSQLICGESTALEMAPFDLNRF